ncbi:hypothetical protein GOP47_0021955 [Adiantum capillus-veneris]|uniref:NADP-dependent oxidoreductase domain-containing protein n=1 Tax=Adiantum capillus-veneris TaxID=13818 RepID=A0A9D4U9D5_ADICA|nr:hypothetical protein GOP47_0021955 [Adiantum capillus-veneris]
MAEYAVLNTGASMPLVGLGTASDGALPLEQRKAAISAAIEVGYRHFDTAKVYNSEGLLGEALKEAMEAGSVKREDLFVTSKLWCTDAYPEGVLPALRNSLSALQLDYLDLYLIHWPIRLKEGAVLKPKPDELMALDLQGTWRALEACVKQGLVRAIGVSNFSSKKIMELLEFAEILPAVNQVEMHPKWQQRLLRETCKKANVHVSAWSPLGAPLMSWGTPEILNNPIIKDIALNHSKAPAQVVLRWGLDNGVSVIPKSFNKKRMVENLDVFGWHLTDKDHQSISGIEQKKNIDGSFLCSLVSGPYRTLEDLWDGEFGL